MSASRFFTACVALAAALLAPARAVELADAPLFSSVSVPGNLALALSVEWPTATTPSYPSTTVYAVASTYVGYFDPAKCYRYVYDSTTPANSFFTPDSLAVSHACTSTATLALWSGNWLNYVTMQTLDVFRWALTGGYRTVDTVGKTVITKTYADNIGGGSIVPDKTLTTGITGATPFNFTSVTSSIKNRGVSLLVTGSNTANGTADSAPTFGCVSGSRCLANNTVTGYAGQNSYVGVLNSLYANTLVTYQLYVNVRVCDTSVSGLAVESNCVAYGTDAKPQGLMQTYSSKLRFSAFGYLNDGTVTRDGGVLRAPMKYVGPTQPVPGSAAIGNSANEWSGSTGIMLTNPDSALATATSTASGITINQSGVMNYLNKFGLVTAGSSRYKSYDPVSELYYAVLRYFRGVGNVPEYSAMTSATTAQKTQWLDGFPTATSWTDPIVYSCQKNFILGIGDVNTHRDANVPGSSLWTTGQEPTVPPSVTTDNTTRGVDTTKSTKMVAQLEGLSSTIGTAYLNAGRYDTYYIAGLAYDAHTNDMRSDLNGKQTVNTYWVDVMEGQVHVPKNEYWLAAKYGGFTVPDGFVPYATTNGTTTLAQTTWYNNTDTIKGTDNVNYKRPDNYFAAYQGSAMVSGLSAAFSKIASETQAATTTAFSSITRKVSSSGNASYAASYDPVSWSGKVTGSSISYAADGTPTLTAVWDGRALLETLTPTTRKIVTCCDANGAALAFRSATLSSTALNARTNYTSFASVPGVVAGSQSAANYVNYLRGDHTLEVKNGGAYRNRDFRLGDIVASKASPVGPPSFPYYDNFNAGYSAFKKAWASRKTIVFAGANDGMMHAFDGSLTATTKGTELFAYVPSFGYGDNTTTSDRYYATYGLASLGNPSFAHHYFVNATPVAFDVDLNKTRGESGTAPDWRSVLIGGMGKGGKGYYAIDITDPTAWTSESAVAGKVLWEFTDSRMGDSFGDPQVVKTAKYGWVVLLPSGYNNSDGKGYLFVVNPRTGALLEAVGTGTGSTGAPINLAELRAWLPDATDYTADAVYAGDLQGNVWRFDLTPTATSYSAPTRLAMLTNAAGNALPVTTKPLIGVDFATKKRYVMVGTGQLLSDSDISSSQLQAFYAVVDGTGAAGGFYTSSTLPSGYTLPLTRGQLTGVTNLVNGVGATPSAMGWYYDFTSSHSIAERMNIDGDVTGSLVGFAANLPNGDACSPAGTGRFFSVSFATGKTALLDSSGSPLGSLSNTGGVITELVFQSVDGTVKLVSGDSGGEIKSSSVTQELAVLQRLNWREISTVD